MKKEITYEELLAEVQRLREENEQLHENIDVAIELMGEDTQQLYYSTLEGNPHAEVENECMVDVSTNLLIALQIFFIDGTEDPYKTAIEGDEHTMSDWEKLQTAMRVMTKPQRARFKSRRVN